MGYALSRCSGLGRHALEGQVGYSAGGLIGVFDPRDPPFGRFGSPKGPVLSAKSLYFVISEYTVYSKRCVYHLFDALPILSVVI